MKAMSIKIGLGNAKKDGRLFKFKYPTSSTIEVRYIASKKVDCITITYNRVDGDSVKESLIKAVEYCERFIPEVEEEK